MRIFTKDWKLEEIENELRAQIELALSHLPQYSHATPHIGFHAISLKVMRLLVGLMREYNVDANIRFLPIKRISLFGDTWTHEDMISHAVNVLENLGHGTWMFFDHPGMIIEGEEGTWHFGAEGDAVYRDAVTQALVSKELQEVIQRRNIQLIGYKDL